MTQAVQTAQNNMAAAASQVNTAQQQVILLSKQADRNAVRAAQAAVAQTESQLAQAKEALNKYTIKANCSGTVKPGQMAQLQFDIAGGAEAENTEVE